LSGIALAVWLLKALATEKRRYSYRVLFIPGTIGSITWLARNEEAAATIKHGLVLACVGDAGAITYKQSRAGNSVIDRTVENVLRHSGCKYNIVEFSPYGYDERQFNSPGFKLNVGRLSRTPHGAYPEYHTSADNLGLVRPEALADSYEKCVAILDVLENNRTYRNLQPKCEPQLGKRGLYRAMGGYSNAGEMELAMLWVLNLSDGSSSLLDIADRARMPFGMIEAAARILSDHQLVAPLD
jgi:aminopeptidase-like protein